MLTIKRKKNRSAQTINLDYSSIVKVVKESPSFISLAAVADFAPTYAYPKFRVLVSH